MNDKREFCEKVRHAASNFISPDAPPDYITNATQYTDIAHVYRLYESHQTIINHHIKDSPTVLDIGTGINFYSAINPKVTTSNPCQRGIGVQELYAYINRCLGSPVSIDLYDICEHDRWIDTDKQFHTVIAHRFLPWYHKPFTRQMYRRLLTEVHRVLLPEGKFLYFTNHEDIFFDQAGKERYIWERVGGNFLRTTKEKLSEVLV